MTFWITTVLMAAIAAVILVLAMLRPRVGADPAAAYDLKVYRDQLKEVERDLQRGVVAPADAERIRAEVSRRILAADAKLQAGGSATLQPRFAGYVVAALACIVLVAGTSVLYLRLGAPGYGDFSLKTRIEAAETARKTRPDQRAAERSLPADLGQESKNAQYVQLVEQLRDTVAKRPDDLQGHILLAQNEAALGNFVAAYNAQAEVLRIKGDATTVSDVADYGDLLVLAAGGYVSPEAESVFARVLNSDPDNGTALYYYGLMLVQTGRPDQAFQVWNRLLRDGPHDAPWIQPIRLQIEDVAMLAGAKFTLPPAGTGSERGPTSEDVAAASEMTAEDRLEMIRGMVNGLSERLATTGGPPEDWARLITALGVLGETERAKAIYTEAMQHFEENEAALEMVRAAARKASLTP